jgi:hypothetical protein
VRIAIAVNLDGVLTNRRFSSIRSTLVGEKTIFRYDIEEIEGSADFARIKSFFGTIAKARGISAILVCQPNADGDIRLSAARATVGAWLDHLATTGIDCRHRDYHPYSQDCTESVLRFLEEFGVKYSKTIEEMMDSTRFLTTTEVATILSEHWRKISARDVRRLKSLVGERSGERRLGYRECDVAEFIKSKT